VAGFCWLIAHVRFTPSFNRTELTRLQYYGRSVNTDADPYLGAAIFYPDNGCFAFELHPVRILEIDRHLDYRIDLKAAGCLEVNAGEANIARDSFSPVPSNFYRQGLAFAIYFARLFRESARSWQFKGNFHFPPPHCALAQFESKKHISRYGFSPFRVCANPRIGPLAAYKASSPAIMSLRFIPSPMRTWT